MFPSNSPEFQLDLYHQHAEELYREAAADRLASSARRHARSERRSRTAHRARTARAPVL